MMKRYRNPVRLAAVSLAFALTGSLTALALPEEGPNTEYEAALARLQDNQLEYDELEELVKNYYGPIKSAYDMLTDTGDMELVAELMYNGLTYKAIADELVISYHTVKKHVQNIYTKCGVKSRFQLYKWLENREQ